MQEKAWNDSALVLVGHGSSRSGESSEPLLTHADAIRSAGHFAQVLTGFWKEEPSLAGVLRGVFAPRAFVIPFFVSEGYFTEEVVPRELGFPPATSGGFARQMQHAGHAIHYGRPVGLHERMTGVILDRAEGVVRAHPFPRAPRPGAVTLLIAGHGTGHNAKSRMAVERQVGIIRSAARYAAVHAVFMEEEPRIEGCLALAATRNVVVVPFFLSEGLHVREDIPLLLGEPERLLRERLKAGQPTWRNPTERDGHLIWYSSPVGTDPGMVQVILDQVRETAAGLELW